MLSINYVNVMSNVNNINYNSIMVNYIIKTDNYVKEMLILIKLMGNKSDVKPQLSTVNVMIISKRC